MPENMSVSVNGGAVGELGRNARGAVGGSGVARGGGRRSGFAADGIGGKVGTGIEDDGTAQSVLQLTDIAGPAAQAQAAMELRRQRVEALVLLRSKAREKGFGEDDDVVAAFAQRGHLERNHREAVEQILAEPAGGDFGGGVAVGRAGRRARRRPPAGWCRRAESFRSGGSAAASPGA